MSHVHLNSSSNALWPHGPTLILRHNLAHCSSTVNPFTPHWPHGPRWRRRRKHGRGSGTVTATWEELESMGCMKLLVWMLWAWIILCTLYDLSANNLTSKVCTMCTWQKNIFLIYNIQLSSAYRTLQEFKTCQNIGSVRLPKHTGPSYLSHTTLLYHGQSVRSASSIIPIVRIAIISTPNMVLCHFI